MTRDLVKDRFSIKVCAFGGGFPAIADLLQAALLAKSYHAPAGFWASHHPVIPIGPTPSGYVISILNCIVPLNIYRDVSPPRGRHPGLVNLKRVPG